MASAASTSRLGAALRRLQRPTPIVVVRTPLPSTRWPPQLSATPAVARTYLTPRRGKAQDMPRSDRHDRGTQEPAPEPSEEELQQLSEAEIEELEMEAEAVEATVAEAEEELARRSRMGEGERVEIVQDAATGETRTVSLGEGPEAATSRSDSVPDSSTTPWFVDPDFPEVAPSTPVPSTSSSAPPPIPSHLPSDLHPLHEHLSTSPFLDPGSLVYIDAKQEEAGMGAEAWADWVAVCQLKEGRERGLAGAADGIKHAIIAFRPGARVRIEGLDNPASTWAMLDAGSLVVHVLTAEAREAFDIEGVWTGTRRPEVGEEDVVGLERGQVKLL